MKRKRLVLTASIIAMILLTSVSVSPELLENPEVQKEVEIGRFSRTYSLEATEEVKEEEVKPEVKEEIEAKPEEEDIVIDYKPQELLLDSGVDARRFEHNGHTVAEGFASDISMDLPVPLKHTTQTKVGFAVAGLGDSWEEVGVGYHIEYTPYVKEMWVQVKGDYDYTLFTGAIFDNAGTGGSSIDFLSLIIWGLDFAFLAYDIYTLLKEVYEEPPVGEWQPPDPAHDVQAIVRQKTQSGYYPYQQWVDPNKPRLQTAGANVLSYFDRDGINTLTITAQAEIYVQCDSKFTQGIVHEYIGTYFVSYEVEFLVGACTLEICARRDGTTEPLAGLYTYDIDSVVTVTAIPNTGYCFYYWTLDWTQFIWDNPTTVVMSKYRRTLTPHFTSSGLGGGGGGRHLKR